MSDPITTAELDSIRGEIDTQVLPDTATIQRATFTPDGGGGETESWADVQTGVPCRIAPVAESSTTRSAMREVGGQLVNVMTHVVTFPSGTDVQDTDRIIVAGVTYEVVMVGRRGSWELSRRVEVREA